MTREELLGKLKKTLDILLHVWDRMKAEPKPFDKHQSQQLFTLLIKILFVHELYERVYCGAYKQQEPNVVTELLPKIAEFADPEINSLCGDFEAHIRAQQNIKADEHKVNEKVGQPGYLPPPEAFVTDIANKFFRYNKKDKDISVGFAVCDDNLYIKLNLFLIDHAFTRGKLAALLMPKCLWSDGRSQEIMDYFATPNYLPGHYKFYSILLNELLVIATSLDEIFLLMPHIRVFNHLALMHKEASGLSVLIDLKRVITLKDLNYENFKAIVLKIINTSVLDGDEKSIFMWALEGVLRVIKAKLQEKIGEDKRINFSIYPLDPPNEIAWRDDMRPLFKACFSAGIAFAAFISCREYLWQQPRFQEYRECVLWNRETPHRYSAIVIAFLRANRGHPFRDSILQMLKQGHLKQVNVPFLQDVAHPFEKKLDAFAGSRFVLSHIAAASQQPQAISAVPPATAVSVVAANRPD